MDNTTEQLIDKYSNCDVLTRLAPVMSILLCLTLSTFVLVYQLNVLETIGSYVLVALAMGLVATVIALTCVYKPDWAGMVGLVTLSAWALFIFKVWRDASA